MQRKVSEKKLLMQKIEQDKTKVIENEFNVPEIKDEQDFSDNIADEL